IQSPRSAKTSRRTHEVAYLSECDSVAQDPRKNGNYQFRVVEGARVMPRRTAGFVPSDRKHRASGQAIVTIEGNDHNLSRWRTAASRVEYDRLVGEWIANGRRRPDRSSAADLTVVELLAAYWQHAEAYYRKPSGDCSRRPATIEVAPRASAALRL